MRSDIGALYPSVYKGILETDALTEINDKQFDDWFAQMERIRANRFVLTADAEGIALYEKVYEIQANPVTENLEFRRQRLLSRMRTKPPFTLRFLRQRLDDLYGAGRYTLALDNQAYTLYIDASVTSAQWYNEIHIIVDRMKPANIVYINRPLIEMGVAVTEEIRHSGINYQYRLGTRWVLGKAPFARFEDLGVIKMAETKSIKPLFLNDLANFTADDVATVLINDSLVVTDFEVKDAAENVANIEYSLPIGATDVITNIKLRKADESVLTESIVYVPLSTGAIIKHMIPFKEVAING